MEIGFEKSSYTANEGDDSVRVCAIIMRGSLQRPESVQVNVSTEDGTATGCSLLFMVQNSEFG